MRTVSYHLIDLVQNLGRPRILVLGDLILDRYTWGDAERISQEAPVILLRERSREVRLGGAANVANMLRGLEADVSLAGVIGNDADGRELRDELERQGVDCGSVIVDPERPTTMKERFIGRAQQRHPHQILRVDREVRRPLPEPVAERLVQSLLAALSSHQALLISDYGKGVCTPDVCRRLITAARQAGLPVIVDPSSSGDCRNFAGATAVTPNRMETKRATGARSRKSTTRSPPAADCARTWVSITRLSRSTVTASSSRERTVRPNIWPRGNARSTTSRVPATWCSP